MTLSLPIRFLFPLCRVLFLLLGGLCSFSTLAQNTADHTLLWQTHVGGRIIVNNGEGYEYARFVLPTPDGGYIMGGGTNGRQGVPGYHGQTDILVAKLDAGGTIQWQKALGGSSEEYLADLQLTPDGGYILTGYH